MGGNGRALKATLLTEYGHFADTRIKNVDRASRFVLVNSDEFPKFVSGQPVQYPGDAELRFVVVRKRL